MNEVTGNETANFLLKRLGCFSISESRPLILSNSKIVSYRNSPRNPLAPKSLHCSTHFSCRSTISCIALRRYDILHAERYSRDHYVFGLQIFLIRVFLHQTRDHYVFGLLIFFIRVFLHQTRDHYVFGLLIFFIRVFLHQTIF